MSGFSLDVALDALSQRHIAALAGYQWLLEAALLEAMNTGIAALEQAASSVMAASFQNPSGVAESAWQQEIQGPYLAILGNTVPYAQRLEYGFSGMTDALGRFYPYWPAYHWAEQTVGEERDEIAGIFQAAINAAHASQFGGH